MSSDFYALFKQPQQPQQDPARKKKGGGKKHDNQFKMKADGTLGKPDKQVTKKRKNSVIEIEDDEDDRPDKHGSLRKHRSPQKKQLTEKNPPKAIHPLFTSNYSQRGGSRGHGTAVKQIHARHPLISESHVQPDSDRAVYVDIGEVPFKRRAGAEKLLEPRESWASTSRFRLTSLNEPTAVPAPAPTSHTRKHNANTNSDNSNTNPPQSSGYALAMSSTLLPHALRPQRPSDVLHNATLATYLSAWMANLALGSPRWEDVRTLQEERKTRKRQCDWIVDDMFDFDLDFDAPPQPSHLPTLPQTGHPDSIESNCILIQGPPGCGKTASVYASAQALGWDVFEVFPGIKRSGKEVLDLVGAVGENHIIGRSKKSLIDQQRMKTHRQSVILFEEVDVLFEEDRGFWGAVQALVQYSKRPVVLTCNDASTIPSNTLTLQATLEFRRPPHDTVRRYLSESGVSIPLELLNGVARPPQAIEDEKSWLIDSGGGLYGEHFDAGCDLRQALMQVHVDTKSGGENSKKHHSSPKKHSSKPFNSLKEAMLKTEALSFVDAHVAQPLWRSMELLESDTPNELIGHETIKRITKPHQTTLAEFTCEGDIARYILDTHNIHTQELDDLNHSLTDARLAQQDILLDMRLDMLGACAPTMPSPVLSVDYAPYVRQLVKCDEEEEKVTGAQTIASNRGTRNSTRNAYRRMYDYDCVASIKGSYLSDAE